LTKEDPSKGVLLSGKGILWGKRPREGEFFVRVVHHETTTLGRTLEGSVGRFWGRDEDRGRKFARVRRGRVKRTRKAVSLFRGRIRFSEGMKLLPRIFFFS